MPVAIAALALSVVKGGLRFVSVTTRVSLFPQLPCGLLLEGSVRRALHFHKGNIKMWVLVTLFLSFLKSELRTFGFSRIFSFLLTFLTVFFSDP